MTSAISDGDDLVNAMLSELSPHEQSVREPAYDFRSDEAVIERARKYLAKLPPAVSGSNGHGATFHAACVLVKGFELPTADALSLLEEYNDRCDPPWSEHELRHKIDDAAKASGSSGYLRNAKPDRWENITVPIHESRKPPNKKDVAAEESGPSRTTLKSAVKRAIEHSKQGRKNLIDLGIPALNRALGGGVEYGEVVLIAARPSHGKSAIALQMISSMTKNGIKCAFISEEMVELTVGKRVLHFLTPVHEDQWQSMGDEINRQADDYFSGRNECELIEGCRTAERAAEEIRRLAADGVKAIVVDYVQLLTSSGTRYETVTKNSVILRHACSETGVLLIVLAQMSRAIEGRDSFIPKTSDLKESGQLEQDADVILFLVWAWKLDQTKDKNEYTIFAAKNRNREIVSPVISCHFDPRRQKISGIDFSDPSEGFRL